MLHQLREFKIEKKNQQNQSIYGSVNFNSTTILGYDEK